MSDPRHPEVVVPLLGGDGNSFAAASRTRAALKRAGVSNEECMVFFDAAPDAAPDGVLATIKEWVTVT